MVGTNVTNSRAEQADALQPENSRLYIGPGIIVRGDIEFPQSKPDERLVICGEVQGNISTPGILQVVEGATIKGDSKIECAEIVVAGTISGENVTIKANLLLLLSTGSIAVNTLKLPPDGLEQSRGGVLNARLDMNPDHGTLPVARPDQSSVSTSAATVKPLPVRTQHTSGAPPNVSHIPSMLMAQGAGANDKNADAKPVVAISSLPADANFSTGFPSSAKAPDLVLPGESNSSINA